MSTKKWRQVSVPEEQMILVDKMVEKSLTYQSSSEYVRHAIAQMLKLDDDQRGTVDLEECTDAIISGTGAA